MEKKTFHSFTGISRETLRDGPRTTFILHSSQCDSASRSCNRPRCNLSAVVGATRLLSRVSDQVARCVLMSDAHSPR